MPVSAVRMLIEEQSVEYGVWIFHIPVHRKVLVGARYIEDVDDYLARIYDAEHARRGVEFALHIDKKSQANGIEKIHAREVKGHFRVANSERRFKGLAHGKHMVGCKGAADGE